MNDQDHKSASIIYLPHGGGPLPLLGHAGHSNLVEFLRELTPSLGQPEAILVISAHWEESVVSITSSAAPPIIYDYFGFPDAAYQIQYPAPGQPALAQRIAALLAAQNIEARLDNERGFDHGLFVPLNLMYPQAEIPCIQISLLDSLDPAEHIKVGQALAPLMQENLLIIGSGFSFHNMHAMKSESPESMAKKNIDFEHWLIETCTSSSLTSAEQQHRLEHWTEAPHARYCHPREEHLLPLHMCYGIAQSKAQVIFEQQVIGVKVSGFQWGAN
ncbi:MAG: dioxygenase [Pseudomonadales bacterium]|nr:dioxygenase [Pseudomonadales bacterium]